MATSQEVSAQVQQLYVAYYGRPGDPVGVDYWTDYFSTTNNVDQALAAFGDSDEYVDNYGSLSTVELIDGLYQQLFNRDAEAEGLTFYADLLDSEEASLASIALDIAGGASGDDRLTLDNKISVAEAYTDEVATTDGLYGSFDIDTARALLANVDETDASVAAGIAAVEASIAANEGGAGLSGVVQDGYVAGATVFVDLDGDGIQGADEPAVLTDANGNFVFPESADTSGTIIASGGTDIATGAPFEGSYSAPAGSTVINPLTTLVQKSGGGNGCHRGRGNCSRQ